MELTEQDKQYTILKIKISSSNTVIKISKGQVYDWGDGNTNSKPSERNSTHTYTNIGEFLIKIFPVQLMDVPAGSVNLPDFYGIELGDDTTRKSLIELVNIGTKTSSIRDTFKNCINLVKTCKTVPEELYLMEKAFMGCTSLETSIIDMSNLIKRNSIEYIFQDCPKLTTQIEKLSPKLLYANHAYHNCTSIKRIISSPVPELEEAEYMYSNTSVEMIDLDYSNYPNLILATGMFANCKKLTNVITGIPNVNLNCADMYKGCDNLKIATSSYNNLADINTASNMYSGCNNIEILDNESGSIYDIPAVCGGKEDYLSLKIVTTNENNTFGFSLAKAISWGDGSTPSSNTENVRHAYSPGTYIVDLKPIDNVIKLAFPDNSNEETNSFLRPLVEVLNVPKNLQLKNLFTVCINLTKVCSLKKNTSTDYSNLFSFCKNLKELPEINYDNIDNAIDMFSRTAIEDIDIYFKNATKIDNLLEQCSNLKKAKVKAGPNCISATGIFASCPLLRKFKLDLSECNSLKSLDQLLSECYLITEDDIKILLPQNLSLNAKYFTMNCNLRNTYKMNFTPLNLIGAFTDSNSIIMSNMKNSTNQAVLHGQASETEANQLLQMYFEDYGNCYKHIKKVHNYWKKFANIQNNVDADENIPCSSHCFALCNDIDIFIDYDTGEKTFGSLGLIPVIWGGAYDSTKNVIAIEITQPNTEFKINNINNDWIDYGIINKCISKDETYIYEKPGRYFVTLDGDFDIPKEYRKYVTQICNLIDTCTFGKDGFRDYKNLKYCCRITENETGDYSNYFVNCKNLINTPEIPNNAVILDRTFSGTKITKPPTIPNSVKSMISCFDECRNLKEDVNIPTTVENFSFAFRNCVNIENFVGNWNNTYSETTKKVAVYKGNANGTIPKDWI